GRRQVPAGDEEGAEALRDGVARAVQGRHLGAVPRDGAEPDGDRAARPGLLDQAPAPRPAALPRPRRAQRVGPRGAREEEVTMVRRIEVFAAALFAAAASLSAQGACNRSLLAAAEGGPAGGPCSAAVASARNAVVHVLIEVAGPNPFRIERPSSGVMIAA